LREIRKEIERLSNQIIFINYKIVLLCTGGIYLERNIAWYTEKKVERTFEGLRRRNMEGYFVKDEEQLIELLTALIPQNSTVGIGDSMTLFETGVIDFLRNGNYVFLDKYRGKA